MMKGMTSSGHMKMPLVPDLMRNRRVKKFPLVWCV